MERLVRRRRTATAAIRWEEDGWPMPSRSRLTFHTSKALFPRLYLGKAALDELIPLLLLRPPLLLQPGEQACESYMTEGRFIRSTVGTKGTLFERHRKLLLLLLLLLVKRVKWNSLACQIHDFLRAQSSLQDQDWKLEIEIERARRTLFDYPQWPLTNSNNYSYNYNKAK